VDRISAISLTFNGVETKAWLSRNVGGVGIETYRIADMKFSALTFPSSHECRLSLRRKKIPMPKRPVTTAEAELLVATLRIAPAGPNVPATRESPRVSARSRTFVTVRLADAMHFK